MNILLAVLFGVTMLYAAATSRIEAYIKILAFQGLLLFFMVLAEAGHMHPVNLALLALETLGIKAIVIPLMLQRVVKRNGIYRELEPSLPTLYSLAAASLIYLSGFLLAAWAQGHSGGIRPLLFGIAVSAVLTGLMIIIARKMLITHVMGFMMMENGIFLLSVSVASEMPLLVNLGVLLDIFMGIFLFGLFITRIQATFDDIHIDGLSDLHEE